MYVRTIRRYHMYISYAYMCLHNLEFLMAKRILYVAIWLPIMLS